MTQYKGCVGNVEADPAADVLHVSNLLPDVTR